MVIYGKHFGAKSALDAPKSSIRKMPSPAIIAGLGSINITDSSRLQPKPKSRRFKNNGCYVRLEPDGSSISIFRGELVLKLKRTAAMLLGMALLVSLLPLKLQASAAETSAAPRVEFAATEPDSNGYFNVSMTIYNIRFRVFQFALKYDTAKAMPVSAADGGKTSDFSAFATRTSNTSWMSTVGNAIDSEKGLIDFSAYILPGTSGSVLNSISEAAIGAEGLKVYTFRFKRIASGDIALKLATKKAGEPYSPGCPQGVIVENDDGGVSAQIVFTMPATLGTGSSSAIYKDEPAVTPTPTPTAGNTGNTGTGTGTVTKKPEAGTVAARLYGTVILQIGNYAAAHDGTLTHIDSENKLVMPTIDSHNRTLVPVRFIAEALGASVSWDGAASKITIKKDSTAIEMTVGSLNYTINGKQAAMDTAPVINTGWNRTLVPARFVAEALNMSVEWDSTNNLVIISPADEPWKLGGTLEKQATSDVVYVLSPLIRDFVS